MIVDTRADTFARYVAQLRRRGVRAGDIKPKALDPRADWREVLTPPRR
jgi:hypothetical protein